MYKQRSAIRDTNVRHEMNQRSRVFKHTFKQSHNQGFLRCWNEMNKNGYGNTKAVTYVKYHKRMALRSLSCRYILESPAMAELSFIVMKNIS